MKISNTVWEFIVFCVFTGIFAMVLQGLDITTMFGKVLMVVFKSVYAYCMLRILVYGGVRSFFQAKEEFKEQQKAKGEAQ